MSQHIFSALQIFEDHQATVNAVAVLPDKRRMVTGSYDKTIRMWDLRTGVVLKKMEGHHAKVQALAVSRDGRIIASGDWSGKIIAWHGETGEFLAQPIEAHSSTIDSLNFSPDDTVLATGSWDGSVKFWCTKTWQIQGEPIIVCRGLIHCVRYSPCGELLAVTTLLKNIEIYKTDTRKHVTTFTSGLHTFSLAWTPDGTRLLLAGNDSTIQEWDTSTWQRVGHPWEGHTSDIHAIAIHPTGTLVASASEDRQVRLWRLSDRQTVAIFQHSSTLKCLAFSVDGQYILSGGIDKKISEWEVPSDVPSDANSKILAIISKGYDHEASELAVPSDTNSKILAITPARDPCLTWDLSTAEELLTQDIHTNANDYTSYAHRSFVMARKHDWDHALADAIESISIQPSLAGHISKGIALCGKGFVLEGRVAFDVASMFTNQDSATNQFLLLIKAIALFNADQHEEAMLLVKELAAVCPNADPLGCRVVETYLWVQLGRKALDGASYDKAADHFTAAVNSGAFSSKVIHQTYEDLTVLFGWDLKFLQLTAHQRRCDALLQI